MAHARDQSQTPYLDAFVDYRERSPGRFVVPGHKGGAAADPGLRDAISMRALEMDIPAGMPGIDVGGDIESNYFQQAQELAADAWGAKRSWFLVNGGSAGNHAICLTLAHVGKSVIVQRNAHSSTIDGMVLGGLEPHFLAPEVDGELGIAHCATPESLSGALAAATPDAIAVMITSPTYFGAVADVASLADLAHSAGIPLIVDEAWGAHLHFSSRLPAAALERGADLVLSSTHKIVGSLTQSAILHLSEEAWVDEHTVDRAVTLIESTSPSGLLSVSLDAARRHAVMNGEELLSKGVDALVELRGEIRGIEGLDVLDERIVGRPGVHAYDPMRLVIDVRGTGVTGHRISELMREVDDINMELASENVVLACFGLGEDIAKAGERLLVGLRHAVDRAGESAEDIGPFATPPPWGPTILSPRAAFLGPQEVVPFSEAEGRVAAESLAAYPPGVPNVLPGERLTAPTLRYIADSIAHGGWVRGASDRSLKTIRVVVE